VFSLLQPYVGFSVFSAIDIGIACARGALSDTHNTLIGMSNASVADVVRDTTTGLKKSVGSAVPTSASHVKVKDVAASHAQPVMAQVKWSNLTTIGERDHGVWHVLDATDVVLLNALNAKAPESVNMSKHFPNQPSASNKSLQVSRDCLFFIKSLFSQVVATRAATWTQPFARIALSKTTNEREACRHRTALW
jgi:hypothetical protein